MKPYTDMDFGLLKVLHALLDTQGVSAAAKRLGVSQPAVSRALARLRTHFDDMLLIRKVGGMVLTPHAEALRDPLAQWMAEGQALLQKVQDPTASPKRTFRIASTDFGLISVIMPAIQRITDIAPDVRMIVTPLAHDSERRLNEGNLDLIVTGFVPDLETVHSAHLFSETYLCITRSGHPGLVDGKMDLATFQATPRIVVAVREDEGSDPIHHKLAGTRIVLWTSEFSATPYLVASTDAVITLPSRVARLFAQNHDLAVFEPPLILDPLEYSITWHERSRRDPATTWLIEQLRASFETPPAA